MKQQQKYSLALAIRIALQEPSYYRDRSLDEQEQE